MMCSSLTSEDKHAKHGSDLSYIRSLLETKRWHLAQHIPVEIVIKNKLWTDRT